MGHPPEGFLNQRESEGSERELSLDNAFVLIEDQQSVRDFFNLLTILTQAIDIPAFALAYRASHQPAQWQKERIQR